MNPHGTSTKRHKPTISNNNHAAVDALRFIDQLDFYLWQASGDEQTVLSRIPSTLTNAQQVAWYNKLLASVSPRPLTLLDLRQALLADFGVDVKTARAVLARAGDAGYIHSLSFRVVLSYIDEIEAGKEREAKLAADRDSAGRKWRRVLVKAEDRYKAELREKQKLVEALGRRIEELELAVKGLTAIIAAKEGRDIAAAWARYESEEKAAREEFREVLSAVWPTQISPRRRGTDRGADRLEVRRRAGRGSDSSGPAGQLSPRRISLGGGRRGRNGGAAAAGRLDHQQRGSPDEIFVDARRTSAAQTLPERAVESRPNALYENKALRPYRWKGRPGQGGGRLRLIGRAWIRRFAVFLLSANHAWLDGEEQALFPPAFWTDC